jgi:hypothetical protein
MAEAYIPNSCAGSYHFTGNVPERRAKMTGILTINVRMLSFIVSTPGRIARKGAALPLSVLRFPVSVFLSPVSLFLFPVSVFLFPVSVSLFPVSVFLFPVSLFLSPLSRLLFSYAPRLSVNKLTFFSLKIQ